MTLYTGIQTIKMTLYTGIQTVKVLIIVYLLNHWSLTYDVLTLLYVVMHSIICCRMIFTLSTYLT